jgi:MHS family citrate/tricarballylate:H+ symporter-like MFS transporter
MRSAISRKSKLGNIIRVTSGNFLEMFDFFLFGLYATNISNTFFPSANEFASTIATFATFGAGFLMRPLGAVILGSYIDRVGRRRGLIATLSIMACGTMLIAFVPGYSTIGIVAPILVLIGRLFQGFSAGVELGGVSVYLSEIATPGHKGFYVSWQSASQQVAIIFAAALGYAINALLSSAEVVAWGWRIPFFVGCLIIPVIFAIRRSLQESEEFLARRHRPAMREIFQSIFDNWRVVLAGSMLVLMTTVSFYLITVYTPTFGKQVLHLSIADSLIVTVFVGLSNFIWLPVMGALSDRVGRKNLLIAFTALAAMTAYPVLWWLVEAPTFGKMLSVELWLSFIYAGYNGAMVAALTEVMPIHVRTVGFSLAYSLATTFGGSTPLIATGLIHFFGDKAAPGWWMAIAALCGLFATFFLYRKKESTARRPVIETGMFKKIDTLSGG